MVPYKCPKCGEFLHMVVFPSGKEYVIDTEEGKVYIARAYTCDNCKTFYTPSPDRLLKEGDIYILDFDNDEYAARDYALLLGRKGARRQIATSMCINLIIKGSFPGVRKDLVRYAKILNISLIMNLRR